MTMTAERVTGPSGLSAEWVEVTPELAERWLGKNARNRRLRPTLVATYAADMRNGDWIAGGDTILFDHAGNLLDGQHRLQAIIESGAAIWMLVVRGAEPRAQDVTDVGPGRSLSDVLTLKGEANTATLAAILRAVTLWEAGSRQGALSGSKPSVPQMLHTLDTFPDLRDVAVEALRVYRATAISPAVGGLAVHALARVDAGDSSHFFDRLVDGHNLQAGSPILELRRVVMAREPMNDRTERVKTLALIFKAWNAYRRGEEVKRLTWNPGGARPEKFPEPI